MRNFLALLLVSVTWTGSHASDVTIGPEGINSKVLGLTGSGSPIGQVERGRPGIPNFDDDMYVHQQVQPTAVYAGGTPDTMDSIYVTYTPGEPLEDREGLHATLVAGVMIAKGAPNAALEGVVPEALLYAGADGAVIGFGDDRAFARTANRIATLAADVHAINVSEGRVITDITQKLMAISIGRNS